MDFVIRLAAIVGLTADNAGIWGAFLGGLAVLVSTLALLVSTGLGLWQVRVTLLPTISARRTQQQLALSFGADSFDEEQIFDAIRYYVPPDCSQVDPSSEEDLRQIAGVREPVFLSADRFLRSGHAEKHLLLLADSGMGKTSFLLNYYEQNRRRAIGERLRIAVLPLGRPDVVDQIHRITDQ
jgi:hypothetical protein